MFTGKLCPDIKEVQAEVTAALVNLVKSKENTMWKKTASVLVQTETSKDLIHGQCHECVFGRTFHQLIWISKEKGFSF